MMTNNGLSKLTEELGEVQQIVGKMLQYPYLQKGYECEKLHPDGTHLRTRLEQELGDVLAAITFVTKKLKLDEIAIEKRWIDKIQVFNIWDEEM